MSAPSSADFDSAEVKAAADEGQTAFSSGEFTWFRPRPVMETESFVKETYRGHASHSRKKYPKIFAFGSDGP